MQITPTVHRIGSFVNQYLLIDNKNLILIDAGMRSNAKTIVKTIKKLGYEPSDLKQLLITHSDPDHYGAAKDVQDATGCEIWSTQIEADAMKVGGGSREIINTNWAAKILMSILRPMMAAPAVKVARIISDGDVLPILSGLQVIASPGHTPGHVSFFLSSERILIAGDAILSEKGKPAPTTNVTTCDPVMAIASAKKLMALNPMVIGCGHAYFDFRAGNK
jgi:glyoxylase-like metal-dependent hydrolase (beta-lactamase superfamily II)